MIEEDGDYEIVTECDWCGAALRHAKRVWPDKHGGAFCSRSHRDQSTASLKRLHDAQPTTPEPSR